MYCTKCGRESPAGSTHCRHCQAPMAPSDPVSSPPRTSIMAVVSLVLGILGIATAGLTAIAGLVLGIVSLVKINRSAGRLRGSGLAIAGICVSGFWIMMIPMMAAMVFPVFARARQSAKKAVCLSNVKHLSLAIQMYMADHDDHFPSANAWSDQLMAYVRGPDAYQCPSEKDLVCGYAYNATLDEASMDEIADPMSEICLFESDAGWNAAGDWDLLTPEPRHLGGDTYGYADGHAAWEERYPSD